MEIEKMAIEVMEAVSKKMTTAAYYKVGSYELGIQNTGSRSSRYFCWCEIFDGNNELIMNHYLADVYTGKWPMCNTLLNRWRKKCEKNKLQPKI